jgi:3-methyladenine DNA glycosylase AlkD
MISNEIIKNLKSLKNPKNIEGMKRFACGGDNNTLGISMPVLRKMAKDINKYYCSSPARTKKLSSSQITSNHNKCSLQAQNDKHQLAQELWESGYHEARILASMVDKPNLVTEKQMDSWISDFDSWDVCDQVCINLFDKTPFSFNKAMEWTTRDQEFEKRAGFALMAVLAWHEKKSNLSDENFKQFLPIIIREATDERNFVKKAVNWALRAIGKSRLTLRQVAIDTANEIINKYPNSKSARWIAKDAIRELVNKRN